MLDCVFCQPTHAWGHSGCPECPYYQTEHYTASQGGMKGKTDIFVVGATPVLTNRYGLMQNHSGWTLDVEQIIASAVYQHPEAQDYNIRFTYAVRCQVEKPKALAVQSCREALHWDIAEYKNPAHKPFVLAMGALALKSLRVPFQRYSDQIGKVIDTQIDGTSVVILPSLSKRQMSSKAGFAKILENQINILFQTLKTEREGARAPKKDVLQALAKQYRYPTTIQDVEDLVEEVCNYAQDGKPAGIHPIAIDTETNTLYPHRSKLELLCVSVAWGAGLAATIPVEHPESRLGPGEVLPLIQKLLDTSNPKLFANAKYDLRVFAQKGLHVRNLAWDVVLGEHLLEEDKKGFYGLKSLTRARLPQYAEYEEELKDFYAMRQDCDALLPVTTAEEKEDTGKKQKKSVIKVPRLRKKLDEDDGFKAIPYKQLRTYAAFDVDCTWRIAAQQRVELHRETVELERRRAELRASANNRMRLIGETPCTTPHPPLHNMQKRILPVSRVLADMELHGMAVNRGYVEELKREMDKYIIGSRVIFHHMLPDSMRETFNPNSNAHVAKVLYGLGYRDPTTQQVVCYAGRVDPQYTETGAISTNKEFLRKLAVQHDCAFSRTLLEYRAISKARTTFIENIGILSEEDGRMHSNFHQHGTATDRLASSEENMQNIPSKIGTAPHRYNIKRIFVPSREDYVIVHADAKAAEVRVFAAYSRDPALVQALNDGMDPHSFFASTVYNVHNILKDTPRAKHEETLAVVGIDKDHDWSYADFQARESLGPYGVRLDKLRKNIKRVVFGILYGAAPAKIASIVGIPDDQADVVIQTLFSMFPTIKTYIDITKEQVRHLGVVETMLGRRRHLPLRALPRALRSRAERQAVNFRIQSTSSGIVLGVLQAIAKPIKEEFQGQLLNTVHDSIIFEIPSKYATQMPALIHDYGVKQVAQQYPWMPVPFSWDVEVGHTYGDLLSVPAFLSANKELPMEDPNDYLELEIRNELAAASAERTR